MRVILTRQLRSIFIFIALVASCCFVYPAELQFLTEEYPPITFRKDGKVTGLATEVVEEIQRRTDSKAPIQVLPWARAYQTALSDPNTVLFSVTRTAERESLFQWVGPLVSQKTSFYALRGTKVKVNSLADAKKLDPIIVVRDYYSEQFLKGEGFTNMDLVANPEQMVKMLMAGRRPMMASDNLLLPALLENAGAKREDVESVYTFMESKLYIAFSKNTSSATVAQWQQALDNMKRDGSYAKIYKKWLPGEAIP